MPLLVPEVPGLNVTFTMQDPPAATALPQVLLWVKSPLGAMFAIANGEFPVFRIVTGSTVLGVPIATLPKLTVLGEMTTLGRADDLPPEN